MPGGIGSLDNVPWLTTLVPFGQSCSAEPVKAKIKYKICNKNPDDAIHIVSDTTSIVEYDGEIIEIEEPFDVIQPGQCKPVDIFRIWDLCDVDPDTEKRTFGMGVQLNARIIRNPDGDPRNQNENVFCSCK